MLTNIGKSLERIATAFTNLGTVSRKVIRYGSILFLSLLVTGLIVMLMNSTVFSFSAYLDMISKSVVKMSFSIAAEIIIGALVLDFVFKK